jgi:hypothetical protein
MSHRVLGRLAFAIPTVSSDTHYHNVYFHVQFK